MADIYLVSDFRGAVDHDHRENDDVDSYRHRHNGGSGADTLSLYPCVRSVSLSVCLV